MSEIHFKDQQALSALVSEEFGPWSNTVRVDQAMIDEFASLSGDDMWLHTDPERCKKESPFGATIAHGFLLLILQSRLHSGPAAINDVTGYGHMMNYGSDRLRFLSPVLVDSDIHARSRIKEVEVSDKKTKVTVETHIHAVGNDSPAVIYELVFVYM